MKEEKKENKMVVLSVEEYLIWKKGKREGIDQNWAECYDTKMNERYKGDRKNGIITTMERYSILSTNG